MMFEDEPENKSKDLVCPTPEEVLEKILDKRKYKPKMFPPDSFQAARYWIAHQEQPNDRVDAAVPNKKEGKVIGWHTPYHDRLCVNLKTFFRLKYIHQVYVIEKVEAGIPWRGDHPDMYTQIVRQAELMQKNPEKYIDSALVALGEFKFGGTT